VHAEHQRGDQPEVEHTHQQALLRRHLEIAAFVVGFGPKEREQAGQREDQDQEQNEIEARNRQENEHRETHQPEPRRERGDNAPAIQKSDWHEIEQIEKKAAVGQTAEHQIAGGKVEALARQRSGRTQQRPANADHRFDPGIARRFLQKDERAHKGDEHGGAHFQAKAFGGQQVSAFVDEHQQNKPDREPNSPEHGVNPNGQDHGAAGFQDDRKKLEDGHQGKFEFGEKRDNGHADRSQGLFHFLAKAGPRWRRRRRHEAIMRIFVLIHGGILA
jgi:hypothetical protein